MTNLIKIGQSQGIVLPDSLIEQARLTGKQLELEVVEEGLLIREIKKVRVGWEKSVNEALETSDYKHVLTQEDQDWLDVPLGSVIE